MIKYQLALMNTIERREFLQNSNSQSCERIQFTRFVWVCCGCSFGWDWRKYSIKNNNEGCPRPVDCEIDDAKLKELSDKIYGSLQVIFDTAEWTIAAYDYFF